MRNEADWKPSKFERGADGRWRASRAHVPISSLVIADAIAAAYADAIGRHARGRLIDLGCGEVPLYAMYRERVESVFCVDWPNSLHGSRFVDVFADLNEPLRLDGARFDVAVSSDVLEHLHTPAALFDSAHDLLEPGGVLILGVPFFYWLHEEPHDHFRYTRHCLDRMARAAGFEPLEIVEYGGAPEILADLVLKNIGGRRATLRRIVYGAARRLLKLGGVRRFSARSAAKFPLGYILVARKAV